MIGDLDLARIAETHVVAQRVAPGASLALAERSSGTWRIRAGAAGFLDNARTRRAQIETPYDLASVTKPVFAATLARLVERGRLAWKDPVGSHLPEAARTASADVPLELLLAHRAGLDAHRTLYAPLVAGAPFSRRASLEAAAGARRADAIGPIPEQGFPPLYSDLGYLLLGALVERISGQPLDSVVGAEIAAPLGLELYSARQAMRQDPDFLDGVAPTELVPWRGGVLTGVVHDENAWALAGHGVAGHAGLFGTARAVAAFGAAVLDALAGRRPDFLARGAVERLVGPRPGGTLRAGFDGVSVGESAAGSKVGLRTFGHLGFTGTSVWCDPDAELVTVILTNRVHPTREHLAIRRARPRIQDALVDLARVPMP